MNFSKLSFLRPSRTEWFSLIMLILSVSANVIVNKWTAKCPEVTVAYQNPYMVMQGEIVGKFDLVFSDSIPIKDLYLGKLIFINTGNESIKDAAAMVEVHGKNEDFICYQTTILKSVGVDTVKHLALTKMESKFQFPRLLVGDSIQLIYWTNQPAVLMAKVLGDNIETRTQTPGFFKNLSIVQWIMYFAIVLFVILIFRRGYKIYKRRKSDSLFVIYGKYGFGDSWCDVTDRLRSLTIRKGRLDFDVSNQLIFHEPASWVGRRKELKLIYSYKNQIYNADFLENEKASLPRSGTEMEKNLDLISVFPGYWELNSEKGGITKTEIVRIDWSAKYYINDVHTFGLIEVQIDLPKISFTKVQPRGPIYRKEDLKVHDWRHIVGNDSEGFKLIYRRIC